MAIPLELIPIGNSTGVVLPREHLERLRVEQGDFLFAVETPDGIELKVYDPEFADQFAEAEKIMREDRKILRKLAK